MTIPLPTDTQLRDADFVAWYLELCKVSRDASNYDYFRRHLPPGVSGASPAYHFALEGFRGSLPVEVYASNWLAHCR
jgi:hypothetical protein